jgi:hypothetical protein
MINFLGLICNIMKIVFVAVVVLFVCVLWSNAGGSAHDAAMVGKHLLHGMQSVSLSILAGY